MLNICVMHHHTGPAPGIMVWGGIGYSSRTPLIRIAGALNSQRYISEVLESQLSFLTFRAWPQPYFNRIMHDDT
ncbi:transposable element Tcb1 transposase [Trichonephila clavipes]|nr:transposable element Tcb1 transposase [Trichonephila clavipes]